MIPSIFVRQRQPDTCGRSGPGAFETSFCGAQRSDECVIGRIAEEIVWKVTMVVAVPAITLAGVATDLLEW